MLCHETQIGIFILIVSICIVYYYHHTQSVRENDVASIEQWISYIKWVQQENNRHPKHIYHKSDPRYDSNHDVPLIDQVDEYDSHYNAVHNAVITNNLDVLDMLHKAGAGQLLSVQLTLYMYVIFTSMNVTTFMQQHLIKFELKHCTVL